MRLLQPTLPHSRPAKVLAGMLDSDELDNDKAGMRCAAVVPAWYSSSYTPRRLTLPLPACRASLVCACWLATAGVPPRQCSVWPRHTAPHVQTPVPP